MKGVPKYILLIFALLFFFLRSKIDFPLTLDEAKESYTAYSIIKTGKDTNGDFPGLFFRSDNNYLSSLGVYFRIPSIYFFGLSNLGARLPSIIFSLITVYVFYLVSRQILKDWDKVLLSIFLFSISPFFIQLNIFDLGMALGLLFILLSIYFFIQDKLKLLLITSFLAVLSSFSTLPFVLVLLSFYSYQKKKMKSLLAAILAASFLMLLFLKLNQGLLDFLIRKTMIKDIHPSSYTHLIDKKLSFGQALSSPLITGKFNFNRIAHNKLFYGVEELFKSIIRPWNFEWLTSSFQSQTILFKERLDSVALPKLFFWEIPIVFLGLILLLKKKNPVVSVFAFGILASVLIFKENALGLALPLVVFSEVVFVFHLKKALETPYFKAAILVLAVWLFFSYLSFLDLFWHHKFLWFGEQDLRQYQIWETLSTRDLEENEVIITDRLGEPVNHFLFYEKVDPLFYQKQRKLGVITSAGIRRVEKVGRVEFRSFKYFESPRGANEIWVGLAGELVGENKDFGEITEVVDGEIFKRIENVKQENKFMGDELWFVKTMF
ncbi:MAG: hypothetical protein ACOYT7_00680 [Patescibacteria group bacterium]